MHIFSVSVPYSSNSKILYPNEFGFQKGHSTGHALFQLVDQIYESFKRCEYTIGVFIDLSKAVDKPGNWFLLAKCLKNTCGRVIF